MELRKVYLSDNVIGTLLFHTSFVSNKGDSDMSFIRRLRSFLGYPPVRDTLPNTTHFSLAALQYMSYIPRIITQNVDGLHAKALSSAGWSLPRISSSILELHGTLHVCSCFPFAFSLLGVMGLRKLMIRFAKES